MSYEQFAVEAISVSVAAGTRSEPIYLPDRGSGITAIPGAGGSMQVFKSSSPRALIAADISNGSLSYANLIAGTQPTNSKWMSWVSGAVTAMTNEGPIESDGDIAVIGTATTQAGVLEVTR